MTSVIFSDEIFFLLSCWAVWLWRNLYLTCAKFVRILVADAVFRSGLHELLIIKNQSCHALARSDEKLLLGNLVIFQINGDWSWNWSLGVSILGFFIFWLNLEVISWASCSDLVGPNIRLHLDVLDCDAVLLPQPQYIWAAKILRWYLFVYGISILNLKGPGLFKVVAIVVTSLHNQVLYVNIHF